MTGSDTSCSYRSTLRLNLSDTPTNSVNLIDRLTPTDKHLDNLLDKSPPTNATDKHDNRPRRRANLRAAGDRVAG